MNRAELKTFCYRKITEIKKLNTEKFLEKVHAMQFNEIVYISKNIRLRKTVNGWIQEYLNSYKEVITSCHVSESHESTNSL